jgi:hypothetical protein
MTTLFCSRVSRASVTRFANGIENGTENGREQQTVVKTCHHIVVDLDSRFHLIAVQYSTVQ